MGVFNHKKLFGLQGLVASIKETIQSSLLPSGAIVWFTNRTSAPSGWAICNGQTVTLSNGASYTTPNLINRYPLGATSNIGTTVEAGLPNITGGELALEWKSRINGWNWGNGYTVASPFYLIRTQGGSRCGDQDHAGPIAGFDASRSNAIYGRSSTVTPPSVKLLPCMKL